MSLTLQRQGCEVQSAAIFRGARGRRMACFAGGASVCAWASLAVNFQQVVHPVSTEEAEVVEASDSEGKPDEHA